MRAAIIVVSLGVLAGCGGAASSSRDVSGGRRIISGGSLAASDAEPVFAEWLPAGLYFRDGHYEGDACRDCAEPRWAVARGPFATVDETTRALNQVRLESMPPGYPWVVHTDDLEPQVASEEGLLVVLGLFAEEGPARALAIQDDASLAFTLSARGDALERLHARLGDRSRPNIIQVDDGTFAPAYDPDEVDDLVIELDMMNHASFEDYMNRRDDATDRLLPSCEVAANSVHLFVGNQETARHQGSFAPVHCPNGELGYVRWTRTRALSVVRRFENGVYRIVQSILVECDVPHFDEWLYRRDGRAALPERAPRLVTPTAGCDDP